ncbi:hypothetical protein ASG32_08005 [Methylobacterium sp. Leaf361]|uniref:hypothetical protein n=1 Tax=Methylobacterium sp. Leaf361 TaxID=1736352 RepID=UPI0006F33F00|nr:hypothetical protein [Methylobacterium sp. Leaf361]KQS75030.1 hypothetical protein ASG32_08005 [Methylobacterium sp. Leaf361]
MTLWVDFEAPQGLVIPDVGSVSYSLYDGQGVPLVVDQALTPEADATGVSIQVLAINNVIAPDRYFERRTALVSWVADGRGYTARAGYRIIDLPNYGVMPVDVRTYLALNEDELRDDEVDLFTAYLTLASAVGKDRLDAALSAGTLVEVRASRAVMLTAATALFPSLRYRIAQAKTDGTLKFERLKDAAAFDGLVAATADELRQITQDLTGDTSAADALPTLLALTTITTDPVTGAAPATSTGG